MTCPTCGQRKAKRACPALGQTICTVCCATKRLVEIDCPADCPHLSAAREHPSSAVKRRQERDVASLLPTIQHLTERQYQLFFILQTVISGHRPEGFARLNDDDVAEAAAAIAATLETAARGVIYEHAAPSPVAQRLANDITAMLEEVRQHGATVYDREAAIVLRAIEQGARDTRKHDDSPTAYLSLIDRLLQVNQVARGASADGPQKPASSIVIP